MDKLPPIEIDPDTFLRQHCRLPALPAVVTKIQAILNSDNINIGKVAELISIDPSLVAEVLKVVNSTYYGLPREVINMKFAIAYLGLNEIYRLVLALSVVNTMSIKEKDAMDKFWFHSLYTAVCTKYLSKKYEPRLSLEELWSAAILHDIGKLLYLRFFPDHYKALIRYSRETGCLFSEAERHFSFPPSATFGALLCHHWRLPDKIKDACESHGLSDLLSVEIDSPSGRFKRMICVGNLTACLENDELNEATKLEVVKAVSTSLNLTKAEFLATMVEIQGLKDVLVQNLGTE